MMGLTEAIASLVVNTPRKSIPVVAVDKAKKVILDTVGVHPGRNGLRGRTNPLEDVSVLRKSVKLVMKGPKSTTTIWRGRPFGGERIAATGFCGTTDFRTRGDGE